MRRLCFSLFALIALTASAGAAEAQPAHTRSPHEDRDQQMVFDDDLLNANLVTPFGDPIFPGHVRPARITLIRPRTSFVPELYKSVEHI